ncbi:FxsA family protein [Kordiimonas sp.]|uniref:FxsA family protein n=1 Tax=Kordiimonas sp. TaxID=1970157 RepID=UPI003A91F7C6
MVELSILIDIGGEIGALPTIVLCFLTAAIGLSLVRQQGISTLRNMEGARVGTSLVHGIFLAIAGLFLLIPGFVTDIVGALLLIPPLRIFLGRGIVGWLSKHRSDSLKRSNIIIEGEFWQAGNPQDHPHEYVKPLEDEKRDTNKPEN